MITMVMADQNQPVRVAPELLDAETSVEQQAGSIAEGHPDCCASIGAVCRSGDVGETSARNHGQVATRANGASRRGASQTFSLRQRVPARGADTVLPKVKERVATFMVRIGPAHGDGVPELPIHLEVDESHMLNAAEGRPQHLCQRAQCFMPGLKYGTSMTVKELLGSGTGSEPRLTGHFKRRTSHPALPWVTPTRLVQSLDVPRAPSESHGGRHRGRRRHSRCGGPSARYHPRR
ncbi:hypothetical protein FB475_3913 [Kribbella jejuensis]|uniref:Uncharacterized protein n=1 Tax=Kribbella jejuensis TaxID=236068 RepID=A0A542EWN8_9ACTN|nr:hypothetical protein FB475_3913 [Kribbella jejuensis]